MESKVVKEKREKQINKQVEKTKQTNKSFEDRNGEIVY
jgi:hypothetical protein